MPRRRVRPRWTVTSSSMSNTATRPSGTSCSTLRPPTARSPSPAVPASSRGSMPAPLSRSMAPCGIGTGRTASAHPTTTRAARQLPLQPTRSKSRGATPARSASLQRTRRASSSPRTSRGRAVAPEGLGELVPRQGPALLARQVGEDESPLTPRKAFLLDKHAIGVDRDPAGQRDGEAHPVLAVLLPRAFRHLASPS